MHNLRAERYVYLGTFLRSIVWETAFQIALKKCSKEAKGEIGIYRIFAGKKQTNKRNLESNIKRFLHLAVQRKH